MALFCADDTKHSTRSQREASLDEKTSHLLDSFTIHTSWAMWQQRLGSEYVIVNGRLENEIVKRVGEKKQKEVCKAVSIAYNLIIILII